MDRTSVFAARLNSAMQTHGFKQIDIVHRAEESGVKLGKSHISQYVSGKTMPRPDIVRFLAATLQVDERWLRGEDTALPQQPSPGTAAPSIDGPSKGKPMRRFPKSSKLDNVLYDVRGPVVDEAARMEAAPEASTPTTQVSGLRLLNTLPTPDMRPPPPMGSRT